MIETFYGTDQLVLQAGPRTFFVALLIGLAFGFALERAGFGSSRKLVGVFYLRDMTVVKVMFTALITAMLGLSFAVGMGWLDLTRQVNLLPTIYGAQAIGGLIFGVGFAMGGWCPGTAAVGLTSGKIDALVFLGGVVLGSIFYNETYAWTAGLRTLGAYEQPLFAFGLSKAAFGFLFTLIAVGAFFLSEWIEQQTSQRGKYLNSAFLKAFAFAFVTLAAAVFIFPSGTGTAQADGVTAGATAQRLLESIQAEQDHFEPEDLADRMLQGDPNLIVVDVRTPQEFSQFHLRGAVNIPLTELIEQLAPYRNQGTIVLYSNGMTHPAQARDILARAGFENVYMLTGGLDGFIQWCLKPVSLRSEVLPPQEVARVNAWRAYFLGQEPAAPPLAAAEESGAPQARFVDTQWLADHLSQPDLKVIDCRSHAEYTTSHVPNSVCVNVENLRGEVAGIPSMLLPADVLASLLSLMGIQPTDQIVIVPGEALRDATLISMALQRVGHTRWAILEGGFAKWAAENRAWDTKLPEIRVSQYPTPAQPDSFTVDYRQVAQEIQDGQSIVLDTRPPDFFNGTKSTEARPGHIPSARSRPYSEDLTENGQLKPVDELAAAYTALIPSPDTPVIVTCRTGHQASQTFFVLKYLLGYKNVYWYDGSWSDWAARPQLPVEKAG